MESDVLFNLGYALFWICLFAGVRSGPLRGAVIVLFHATTILVVIVNTSAHQYFRQTGTMLDYNIIALYLPRMGEIKQYGFIGVVSPWAWVLLAVLILYATFGPWLLTLFVCRLRGWQESLPSAGTPQNISFLSSLGLCLLALVFGLPPLLIGFGTPDAIRYISVKSLLSTDQQSELSWRFSKPFVRDPFVNLVVSASDSMKSEESANIAVEPPPPANFLPTSGTEQRNVVLIILESTRAQSVTPYNEDLDTTPFLNELAKSSLVAEQAHAVVPYTSKALVAINCGIEPNLVQAANGVVNEAEPKGIPTECLATLLEDQGYSTAFFQPVTENFENRRDIVKNFGYEEFYPLEYMDTNHFEQTNYVNPGGCCYEDNIMLESSEDWLETHKDKPFLTTYLTTTPHHEYVVPKRYGEENFSEDEMLNRYLNTVRYEDFFLKNLFDQYKKLGLYEDTVFVILGDHGEGFGEHGIHGHGDIVYEEGLRIPLIIHDPKRFQSGATLEDAVTELDILPTVADLLGYQIEGGAYGGNSLLRQLPKDRTLMFSCWIERRCLASLKGTEKYIYYYDNQPNEVFDLSKDSLEKHNLAEEGGKENQERRNELLAWRSRIAALYRVPPSK